MRDAYIAMVGEILVGSADASKVRIAFLNATTTVVNANQVESRTVALQVSVSLTLEDFLSDATTQYNNMAENYLAADVKLNINTYTEDNNINNTPEYSAGIVEISDYLTFATSDSAAPTGEWIPLDSNH